MSKKRRDLGKRQNGFWDKFKNWAGGQLPPDSTDGYIEHGQTVTQWAPEYNDTPLDGDRYVNGQCCRTVGEYKAACEKFYGP